MAGLAGSSRSVYGNGGVGRANGEAGDFWGWRCDVGSIDMLEGGGGEAVVKVCKCLLDGYVYVV